MRKPRSRKNKRALFAVLVLGWAIALSSTKQASVGASLEMELLAREPIAGLVSDLVAGGHYMLLRDLLGHVLVLSFSAVLAILTPVAFARLKRVFVREIPHEERIFRDDENPKKGDYEGYVYVLSNASMPGILKIGYTSKRPDERAKELSSTGVATPFRIVFVHHSDYAKKVERQVHRLLDEVRVARNREFFRIDRNRAVAIIEDAERHVRAAARRA